MPPFNRRLGLVVLLALLAATLPAAAPAHAAPQTFTVTTTADADDGGGTACQTSGCTLREAIRLANENPGPDTINFAIGGAAPFTISPASPLPPLSGGETTITVSPAHSVVLSGVAAGAAYGLQITSADNEVRGLVVVGFSAGQASTGGSGISLSTVNATGNRIFNNRLGIQADGSTAFGNAFYGVQLDERAHDNQIGGLGAGQGNVISGNLRANVAVEDSNDFTTGSFISGNQILGNFIGTNAAGTGLPTSLNDSSLEAGVLVGTYARSTVIRGNRIGGHIGPDGSDNTAGILVRSTSVTPGSGKSPLDTQIIGNDIGATPTGGAIKNRIGIRIGFGSINTLIGDPADPVGGRNVIANVDRNGIQVDDNAVEISGTQIVGNYIGIARDGTTLAAIGAPATTNGVGIYLGTNSAGSATVVGPGNVIAAVRRFGIQVRSSNNTIRGNFIGTNPAGTATSPTTGAPSFTLGLGTGDVGILVENGADNQIGGPGGGDRNVIAIGGSTATGALAAILISPNAASCGSCSVSATTVQGNYLGVKATGDGALASSPVSNSEGLRISGSSGNTVRGNVIGGTGRGITLRNGANTNTIDANKIGTSASGSLAANQGIGNTQHGIYLLQGTGNQITSNVIGFNGSDSLGATAYHGISVENSSGGANNNTIRGNRLARNGSDFSSVGHGINVQGAVGQGPTGILISQNSTSSHRGDGIALVNGNGGLARPTLSGVSGTPPTLAGTAAACGTGCTVEVFTSPTSDTREGPVYLTSGTTTAGGAFSINVTGCLRYLTATVRAANNNTSPYSEEIDTGAAGPCVPTSFSLGAASPNTRSVEPGSSTTYAHSITNNAAVARTFTVVITSTRGWASAPALVTVPANGSASFDVLVSVPLTAKTTAPADSDVTSVQVFLGPNGSNVQTDTTTAQTVTLNPAAPAVSPGQTKARAGTTVTFTHAVTNTGDLAGTFSVVGPSFLGTAPASWSIASAVLGKTSLAGGESTSLTITVNTPAGAPAAPVQLIFRVAVSGGQQTDPPTIDTITVPVARSFTFVATSPTGSPPTVTRPPGASAEFVYTLTNTGNASDNFQVTPPANTGQLSFSVSPSGSFALAAGASRTITLTAQIPSGTAAGSYDFTVSAAPVGGTGAPPAQGQAGRVTVTGGGAPLFVGAASVTPNPVTAGSQVTIVHTVRNSGNQAAAFSFATTTLPAGWTVQSQSNTCPATVPADGSTTCTVTTVVNVPAGADGGSYSAGVSATADNGAAGASPEDVTVSATATVNVAIVRAVALSVASPADAQVGAPGEVVTFTHTLTNQGNAADSFTISLAPTAPATAGMAVLSPTSLTNVPRNATRTVTLAVTVPGGLAANTALAFTITAASQGDPSKTAQRTDTATVEAFDGASLSPGQIKSGLPGTTVTFTHTLTNTGSTAIAYDLTATNSQAGFDPPVISSGATTAVLNPGDKTTITVDVTLPANILGGISNETLIKVTETGTADVLASVTDTVRVGNQLDVLITPNREGIGLPGQTLVFTHTVTNIGITPDTYTLTAADASLGWPTRVSPDLVTLAPGASQEVTVSIDVPNTLKTLAGITNFVRVTATSIVDPDATDSVGDDITLGRLVALELTADQARPVTPTSGRIRLNDLALRNNGNATERFDITVTGADAGWRVEVQAFDVVGPKETDQNISVWVTVPPTVASGVTKTITIRATSRSDPTVTDEVNLRFVYIAPPRVQILNPIYLPLMWR